MLVFKASALLFVLLSLRKEAEGWRQYEESIVEPGEVQDNRHEFFLEIAPKLSMSIERAYKSIAIVDFNPDTGGWEERVENQLRPCGETHVIANTTTPLGQSFFQNGDDFEELVQQHGLHSRVPSINGDYPGKTLVVMMDTEIVVRVRNSQLLNSLTARIHGLDNRWYEDGEAYVQQCPVAVRSEHVYRWTANRQGTMIFRAAFPSFGPINSFAALVVVKRRNERLAVGGGASLPIHAEYMMAIQDWPFVPANQQRAGHEMDGLGKWGLGLDRDQAACTLGAQIYGQRDPRVHAPAALVLNGKGWHNQTDVLLRPSVLPLATYRIRAGNNTLFRIAHIGFDSGVRIHIEDHELMLAVADGTHTIPRRIDAIYAFPGERYNFFITGKQNPQKRVYRIVVQTVEKFPTPDDRWLPIFGLANLEYEEEVAQNEAILDEVDWNQRKCAQATSSCVIANCPRPLEGRSECLSAGDLGFPDDHDLKDILKQKVYDEDEFEEHFISINQKTKVDGYSYKSPSNIPFYSNHTRTCADDPCNKRAVAEGRAECRCFHLKQFGLGKVIQLVLFNMGPEREGEAAREIPFHLRNTHFFLVKWAGPEYAADGQTIRSFNRDIRCNNPEEGCFGGGWADSSWSRGNVGGMSDSPPLRDTVVVPYGGYIVIRFRATTAGWFMAESTRSSERQSGVAFAFRVGSNDQVTRPPPDFPTDCGTFEAPPLSLEQREAVFRTVNM
ncbi:hypothetical protein M3Y99_00564000 [Aphelenchoides fujianensis]|nr:hypothetical protein M3Y99_00564000 [Aphelenchoides fujianensis]